MSKQPAQQYDILTCIDAPRTTGRTEVRQDQCIRDDTIHYNYWNRPWDQIVVRITVHRVVRSQYRRMLFCGAWYQETT